MIVQPLSAQAPDRYSLYTYPSPSRFTYLNCFIRGFSRSGPFYVFAWGTHADGGDSWFCRVCFVLRKLLSNVDTARSRTCNIRDQLLCGGLRTQDGMCICRLCPNSLSISYISILGGTESALSKMGGGKGFPQSMSPNRCHFHLNRFTVGDSWEHTTYGPYHNHTLRSSTSVF